MSKGVSELEVSSAQLRPATEDKAFHEDIDVEVSPAKEDVTHLEHPSASQMTSEEMRARMLQHYGRRPEEDDIAPRADISQLLDLIVAMNDEEALDILVNAIEFHKDDPNFSGPTMQLIRLLVQGAKVAEMDPADWSSRCELKRQ
jgi:hypothetical protein